MQVRCDGPPGYEMVGSDDDFQTEYPVEKCGCDNGMVDSGGQNPDGSWINIKCPECRGIGYLKEE